MRTEKTLKERYDELRPEQKKELLNQLNRILKRKQISEMLIKKKTQQNSEKKDSDKESN